MERITSSTYAEKQKAFVSLIKDVQTSLVSKEYKKQGYSLNEYTKMRWNISQAQAYRYLICGKVLDQLEEFEIKPSYERLCKSLYNTAKTRDQMKLLWSFVVKRAGSRPDFINSTHISKVWKELCKNKKYSHICHFEETIMAKVEKSLNKHSTEKKQKQLKSNINSPSQISVIPSPSLSENSPKSNLDSQTIDQLNIFDDNFDDDSISILLSPVSNCSSISCDYQFNSIISPSTQSNSPLETFYYLQYPNDLYSHYQQSLTYIQEAKPLTYIQGQPQQIIYYC